MESKFSLAIEVKVDIAKILSVLALMITLLL